MATTIDVSAREHFDRIKLSLDIFGTYRDSIVDFNIYPAPSSFPNGAPDHSRSCQICIELSVDPSNSIQETLKKFGWYRFEEGYVWELRV